MSNPETLCPAEKHSRMQQGVLIRGIGGFYTVLDAEGQEHTLRCKKKFRRQHLSPITGDEVLFSPRTGEEHGWLEEVLPRKTVCLRPPVANVTRLIIVLAPVPEPDLLLTDRLLNRAAGQGMETVIAVNKTDLNPELAVRIKQEYQDSGIPVIPVSALYGEGLAQLRENMTGAVCCLVGQSGAGKTTLLNALLDLQMETGEISRRIARGKNTTRQAELIVRNGLRVMDTAGFNLLEPERGIPPEQLKERYSEFRPFEGKCRFRECLHDREPGCAVTAAAEAGCLNSKRVERYRQLLAEIRETWKERYE